MDTEYKIYVDEKFDHVEEKIDAVAIDVNTIKTVLETEDKIESGKSGKSDSKWSKTGIGIGSIAAVIATLAIFL